MSLVYGLGFGGLLLLDLAAFRLCLPFRLGGRGKIKKEDTGEIRGVVPND